MWRNLDGSSLQNTYLYSSHIKPEAFPSDGRIISQRLFKDCPSFSSFTFMIISIIRGGRGLKNDDKHHNYFIIKKCSLSCFTGKKFGGFWMTPP